MTESYQSRSLDEKSAQIFEALHNETARLFLRWKLYRCLYSDSPKDFDTWNLTQTGMFTVLKTVLFEDLVLRLCKLTESSNVYGNLSINALDDALNEFDPNFARKYFSKRVRKLTEKCNRLRAVRNKRIAHMDRDLVFNASVEPVPTLRLIDIKEPIQTLEDILNVVAQGYGREHTSYGDILMPVSGDGEQLIELLRRRERVN